MLRFWYVAFLICGISGRHFRPSRPESYGQRRFRPTLGQTVCRRPVPVLIDPGQTGRLTSL